MSEARTRTRRGGRQPFNDDNTRHLLPPLHKSVRRSTTTSSTSTRLLSPTMTVHHLQSHPPNHHIILSHPVSPSLRPKNPRILQQNESTIPILPWMPTTPPNSAISTVFSANRWAKSPSPNSGNSTSPSPPHDPPTSPPDSSTSYSAISPGPNSKPPQTP